MYCYFLSFRVKQCSQLRINKPTGGLVVEAERVLDGNIPVCDINLVRSVMEMRYHCDRDEELVIAQVFEDEEKFLAARLHQEWETEMLEFKELMEA